MRIFIIITLLLSIISCQKPTVNTLTVGVIAGPESDLLKTTAEIAAKLYGLHLKIVEFNDYTFPNIALDQKSIDVNVFQHLPYLLADSERHGYDFSVIGKTFLFPIELYSKKLRSLDQIPEHAVIAIPNDPSNEVRALLLLQQAGIIQLKKSFSYRFNDSSVSPLHEIIANPKSIKIKEIDAPQLPRVLEDVDAAVINTNYAKLAGLTLVHDAIAAEEKESPYAEVVVTNKAVQKKEQLASLIKALHSKAVQEKAQTLFGAEAIAAW